MPMTAATVYATSDGELTKRYYAELSARGVLGFVAMNLFRAQKCSARAKLYRGGGYKGAAYERKNWSMGNLAQALTLNGAQLAIPFGWKEDPAQQYHSWVLYVDLPEGQVSFHAASRGEGPDYTGEWDGHRLSAERILAFCDRVSALPVQAAMENAAAVGVELATAPDQTVEVVMEPAPVRPRFGDPDHIAAKRGKGRSLVGLTIPPREPAR